MAKAWYVNLNDCEFMYVFAEDETDAEETGLVKAEEYTGCEYEDERRRGVVEVTRASQFDGDHFTYRQFVDAGKCVNEHDPMTDEELDLPHQAIYLSTEY